MLLHGAFTAGLCYMTNPGKVRDVRPGCNVDIAAWLRSLGLEQYEPAFRDNAIDGEILRRLTAEDLKEIGVTALGHRKRLLEAIAALSEPSSPPATGAPPSPPARPPARAKPSGGS